MVQDARQHHFMICQGCGRRVQAVDVIRSKIMRLEDFGCYPICPVPEKDPLAYDKNRKPNPKGWGDEFSRRFVEAKGSEFVRAYVHDIHWDRSKNMHVSDAKETCGTRQFKALGGMCEFWNRAASELNIGIPSKKSVKNLLNEYASQALYFGLDYIPVSRGLYDEAKRIVSEQAMSWGVEYSGKNDVYFRGVQLKVNSYLSKKFDELIEAAAIEKRNRDRSYKKTKKMCEALFAKLRRGSYCRRFLSTLYRILKSPADKYREPMRGCVRWKELWA